MTQRHLNLLMKRTLLSLSLLLLSCNAFTSADITGYYKCEDGCYDINSDCICDQRCDTNDPHYQAHLGCSFILDDQVFIITGNSNVNGVYLPSSFRSQDSPVYLNEAAERFMHRTTRGWLISSYRHLAFFLDGRGGSGHDPILNGWNVATESVVSFKVTLAFSPLGAPFADDNHLAGNYFISGSYIFNGRGVYENEARDRFVAFNGAKWVITDATNLHRVSAGAAFSGFASSEELSGTYQASSGSSFFWVSLAAEETCDAAPSGRRAVMRCINRCTPSFDGFPTASICAEEAGTCQRASGGYSCGACGAGYEGNGYTCTDVNECSSGTHTCDTTRAVCGNEPGSYSCSCNSGYVGDGVTCYDIDECAVGSETSAVGVNSTLANPGGAIDGLVHNGGADSWREVGAFGNEEHCNASQYVVLDLGEVKKVSGVSFWNYYDDQRQYCGQSVELSSTGAFEGEQTQVFSCGEFEECGYASATGRVLVFEPTVARYVRVGSSRNNRNTGIHILDVVVRAVSVCSLAESCTNTDGGFKCSLPVTEQELRDIISAFDQDSSCRDLDTSQVTDMSSLFLNAPSEFDCDISGWDVSGVTNMAGMFRNFDTFNQDLSGWDTSSVTNMDGMFYNARNFNADISDWDVSGVTIMRNMFRSAITFNQDISPWNVGAVKSMPRAFFNAASFTQDLSRWTDLLPASVVGTQANIFGGSCPKNTFAGLASTVSAALAAESTEAPSQVAVLSEPQAAEQEDKPSPVGITTPWVAASVGVAAASLLFAIVLLARRMKTQAAEEGAGQGAEGSVKAEVAFVAAPAALAQAPREARPADLALAGADMV